MTKYRVHIYAIVRVPVDVEAESPEKAVELADQATNLHEAFRQGEYADDIDGFLVDELGPQGIVVSSQAYDKKGRPQ